MADSWDTSSWDTEHQYENQNVIQNQPIYSQSFSRGGRGNRQNFRRNEFRQKDNENRNYGGGNRSRNFDGGNRNRDYDGGKRNRDYDGGNRNRNFDRGNQNRNNDGTNDEKKIIQVETNQVGRIIGRGGSKIKQLEQDSGARITVISFISVLIDLKWYVWYVMINDLFSFFFLG